jgi:hypothetical protein
MRYLSLIFILLTICFLFGTCKNDSNFNAVSNNVSINSQIDSLLRAFIKENEKIECQYYLVTYLSCGRGQKIVTLIANNFGDSYYFRNESLVYFIRDNKKIYLITGSEDLFKRESEIIDSKHNNIGPPFSKMKSYVIDNNKIEFIPHGIPPFAPPPMQHVR